MLDIQNLCLSFKEKKVIQDVSFTVNKGECFGIIGPSGTGKSTLLNVICGLLKPESGEIRFLGDSLNTYNIYEYRKRVRYIPPKPDFFQGTVQEHFNTIIKYLKAEKKSSLEKVLQDVNELFPDSSILTRKTGELSTGEAKRILLIQNFLSPPDIFVLDEVFTGLDPSLAEKALTMCQSQCQAVIATSHEIGFMQKNMNRMVFYKNGQILEESRNGLRDAVNREALEYLNGSRE